MRIIHIITDLDTGGAEMMLFKLLATMDRRKNEHHVISLLDHGTLGEKIKALGIPIHVLELNRWSKWVCAPFALVRVVRKINPDIIQGWMYHGNLVASFVALFQSPSPPVLWNIRQSLTDIAIEKRLTVFLIKVGALLSKRPVRILYNSHTAATQHEALGYNSDKTFIIPNGFDVQQFRPDVQARISLRQSLGVAPDTQLIGLIARYHPMKDHDNFLQAAILIRKKHSSVKFVLMGKDVDASNRKIMSFLQETAMEEQVFLLGERTDVALVTAALDVAVNASRGESFPNAVGEAMACAVPCVVTDVGDSARIVGETGKVVPPRNPVALAEAINDLLDAPSSERENFGHAARLRIIEHFSIQHIASEYEGFYGNLLK